MVPPRGILRVLGHPLVFLSLLIAGFCELPPGRARCGHRMIDRMLIRRLADHQLEVIDSESPNYWALTASDESSVIASVSYQPESCTTFFFRSVSHQLRISPLHSTLLDPGTLLTIHREVANWMASSPHANWPYDAAIIARGGDKQITLRRDNIPRGLYDCTLPFIIAASFSCFVWRHNLAMNQPLFNPLECSHCKYPTIGLPGTICPECGHDRSTDPVSPIREAV